MSSANQESRESDAKLLLNTESHSANHRSGRKKKMGSGRAGRGTTKKTNEATSGQMYQYIVKFKLVVVCERMANQQFIRHRLIVAFAETSPATPGAVGGIEHSRVSPASLARKRVRKSAEGMTAFPGDDAARN
ncbi:hypothetical protein DMN91_003617 [Ooceraea biroi]|uniref:Uncharacterized protein n=1 Tax=Ooceraea biroi TaxID=2015173 RepID=A0A3L8DTC2_OOCBI|nr:hypothetical protein DMN91_003617 [Ooceraea biroi]